MFYYNPEKGWGVHPKKITFTEQITVYDTTDESYKDKINMISEDVILTDEQLKRLETIKHVYSMGINDVETYVFDAQINDRELVDLREEVKAEETRQKLARLIRWDELTTEEMLDLIDDFKDYEVGAFYIPGDIFNYNNQLYKVLQSHTSQEDWAPSDVPALYLQIAPPVTEDGDVIVPEWAQPTGGHDAYAVGDKVTYNDSIWVSKIAGNTTKPDGDIPYNRYWEPVV